MAHVESGDKNPEFMKHLSEDPLDKEEEKDDKFVKSLFRYLHCVFIYNLIGDLLYRLSDATGKMVFSIVGEGSFSKSSLDPNDGKDIVFSATQRMYQFLAL